MACEIALSVIERILNPELGVMVMVAGVPEAIVCESGKAVPPDVVVVAVTLKVVVAVLVARALKVAITEVVACTFVKVELVAVVVASGLPLAVSTANSKPTFGVITKFTLAL